MAFARGGRMKYIVKNCPTFNDNKGFYYSCKNLNVEPIDCQDCTDCLIKQVIEKCRDLPFSACACGDEILQLFEIEEYENDR